MKKGRVQKLWLLQVLLMFAVLTSGGGAQSQQPQNQKLYMEYYYVPACENCEDGPGYAAILEGMVDDVMERGTDYELEVKSLADQEVYAQFQEIVETYQTDDFYPTPPVLKIGSEYLFGEDQIEAKTRSTAIAQLNAMLTPEQVLDFPGHAVGGVCPFGIDNPAVTTYLDVSLRRFDTVYPAAGNAASAVRLNCEELFALSNSAGWIDVCKNWH